MLAQEIQKGNRIITSADRKGNVVAGRVISKGPKYCGVMDVKSGQDWSVPYSMIIAVTEDSSPLPFVDASEGDLVLSRKGEQYRITKKNSSRYTATRVRDGESFYLPFHHVVEVIDETKDVKLSQKEWLRSKGLSANDVAEFEKLFLS